MIQLMFFSNGSTAAFGDGSVIQGLQRSWFRLVIEDLVARGIDPLEVEFTMPNGSTAKVFQFPKGGLPEGEFSYSWSLLSNSDDPG